MAFVVGDIVKLKSGSPKMTITGLPQGKALCSWFLNDNPASALYPQDALEYDQPQPTDPSISPNA